MPAHRSWPDVAPTLNSSATADLSRAGDPPAARTASTAAACGITCPLPAAASKAADKAVVCVDARRSTAAVTRWWRRPQSASTASAPATTSSAAGVRPGPSPITSSAGPTSPVAREPATPSASASGNPNAEGGCSPSTSRSFDPCRTRSSVDRSGRGSHHRTGRQARSGPTIDPLPIRTTLPASGSLPVATVTPIGRRTASLVKSAITGVLEPGSGTLRYDATVAEAKTVASCR